MRLLQEINGKDIGIAMLFTQLLSCHDSRMTTESLSTDAIKGVQVYYRWELFSLEMNRMLVFMDSIDVFDLGEEIVYKLPKSYHTSHVPPGTARTYDTGTVVKEETRYSYFVYRKRALSGIKFDSLSDPKGQVQDVRPVLSSRISINESMFYNSNLVFTDSKRLAGNGLWEVSIPNKKIDESYSDSNYYYYMDSLKEIDFSLSRTLDSLRARKLVKVIMVYNIVRKAKSNWVIPRREIRFELRPIAVIDTAEIRSIVKKSGL